MSTPITLDRPRHLRYTANAIADVEEVLGEGIGPLISSSRKVGFRHARAFLWAGLKHEDRKLQAPGGLERAGDLIDIWFANGGTLDGLYEKILKAMQADGWFGKTGQANEGEEGGGSTT